MLTKTLELRKYVAAVESGERKIDHIWAFHVAKFMRAWLMWYDTDQWAKTPTYMRILHVIIFLVVFLLWILLVLRVFKDFDDLPISRIAEGVSLAMGGLMSFTGFCTFYVYRDELTEVIRAIDEKFRAVSAQTESEQEWWKGATKTYIFESKILFVYTCMGICNTFPGVVAGLLTGKLYYDTIIPLSDESYTWQWWLQYIYQSWDGIYSGIFYSFKEFLSISVIYYLSLLVRVQAEKINHLFEKPDFDPEEEYDKLKGVYREMIELYEIGEKIKDTFSFYLLIWFNISFLMMSISGLAAIIESKDSGWLHAIAVNSLYPSYVLCVSICWTTAGEFFKDSFDLINDSQYNCNWMDSSQKTKKLMLIYKIRNNTPNVIEGRPLFVLNMELLSDIIKKTYYFLTLLMDFID